MHAARPLEARMVFAEPVEGTGSRPVDRHAQVAEFTTVAGRLPVFHVITS